ncbi:MAG: AraC family transcriptional regulator [Hyphomicrobiaceae bacterium]
MIHRQAGAFEERAFADPGQAESFLSDLAESISKVRFVGERRSFHLSYAGTALGHASLHRGRHSQLTAQVSRADEMLLVIPERSGLRFSGGGVSLEAQAGQSAIFLPPRSSGVLETRADITAIALVVPRQALEARARTLRGDDGGSVKIIATPAVVTLTDPLSAALVRNVTSVMQEMKRLAPLGMSEVTATTMDELLIALASAVVVPSVRAHIGEVTTRGSGSASVHKARAYLEAHAAEPVRLGDLAQELGIGLRALQLAFRRETGMTLRDYLGRRRLELAHQRLTSGEAETVASVAFECGFTDLASFAAKYRATFGELPSETLRKRR